MHSFIHHFQMKHTCKWVKSIEGVFEKGPLTYPRRGSTIPSRKPYLSGMTGPIKKEL